jgi:hypothetical protein
MIQNTMNTNSVRIDSEVYGVLNCKKRVKDFISCETFQLRRVLKA